MSQAQIQANAKAAVNFIARWCDEMVAKGMQNDDWRIEVQVGDEADTSVSNNMCGRDYGITEYESISRVMPDWVFKVLETCGIASRQTGSDFPEMRAHVSLEDAEGWYRLDRDIVARQPILVWRLCEEPFDICKRHINDVRQ